MNAVKPNRRVIARRAEGGFRDAEAVVSGPEKALCQERKSDFIPLDNIYGYPLYSEGFSLCGRARPNGLENVRW
jgi:hypothetical protein